MLLGAPFDCTKACSDESTSLASLRMSLSFEILSLCLRAFSSFWRSFHGERNNAHRHAA